MKTIIFVGTFLSAPVFIFSGTSQLSSGDASDSICPKGWGMAGYSGDRSYDKLIKVFYGENKNGEYLQGYRYKNNYINANELFKIIPLSFYTNGLYGQNSSPSSRNEYVGFIEKIAISEKSSSLLYSYRNFIRLKGAGNKGAGLSLRCVAKLFVLFFFELNSW